MTEVLRQLAAILLLWFQIVSQGYGVPGVPTLPIPPTRTPTRVTVPTPTQTAPPLPTWTQTETATLTATPSWTRTPSRTQTPQPTRTPTQTLRPTRIPGETDPIGLMAQGEPPAQKLPSAVLVYPLVRVSATSDTRIEMYNLTAMATTVQCFYVTAKDCNEIGFFVSLTANQPLSWMASNGLTGNGARIAPRFSGDGELKCVDMTPQNALQGRAIVTDVTNTPNAVQTIGYTAIGFRRLVSGPFRGSIRLDGINYEACPDRLHFNALSQSATSDSELILVPCTQDLVNQIPSQTTVQYAVINEFEQNFSGSSTLKCMDRRRFSTIPALRKSSIGSNTAHLIVRSIDMPVIGLVIDRFTVPGSGALSTSSNEPYLEGSRAATVDIPFD